MKRPQLEHIIRASADITGADEFVVIDSQAVLGQFPNAPPELIVSIEADVLNRRNRRKDAKARCQGPRMTVEILQVESKEQTAGF